MSTLTDYFVARRIETSTKKKTKKILVFASVFVNLAILFSFKYADFFVHNINWGLNLLGTHQKLPFLKLILPVGISFYTFQTMSYTIDVYRGRIKPEKNLWKLALYVSFFPQLVAGPIERAGRLLPQFSKIQKLDFERIAYGLKLMVWGFFLKVVVADNLMGVVNLVHSNPEGYKGLSVVFAAVFFAFQIYGDFAGYTNIAVGAAYILGFKLMRNFKQPYLAISIGNFWQRWHISLSSWFKDYVYISLGGNKVSLPKWWFLIMLTFVLSGFWHGAEWTFVIWGAIHGFTYLIEKFVKNQLKRKPQILKIVQRNSIVLTLRIVTTFTIVALALMFFRAENMQSALILIKNVFSFDFAIRFDSKALLINILLIALVMLVHKIELKNDIIKYISAKPAFVRFSIYYFVVLAIVGLGNWNFTEFIYFQF